MALRKFCKRLSSFLKPQKYKARWRSLRLAALARPQRAKLQRMTPSGYNGSKHEYVHFLPHCDRRKDPRVDDLITVTKKYGTKPSMILKSFSRKYIYHYLGRETVRRYHTMPFRLSMSRFISFLTFKGYYGVSAVYAARKASRRIRCKGGIREIAKNVVTSIERVLGSSLLRLFQFKPQYTVKIPTIKGGRTKWVKSPWSQVSQPQVQQLISHGHIFVNTRPATHYCEKLKVDAKIRICWNLPDSLRLPCRAPWRALSFSNVFYAIYRNAHLSPRHLCAQGCSTRIEKDINRALDAFWESASRRKLFTLWPVLSLLKVSSWTCVKQKVTAKQGAKEDKWEMYRQIYRLKIIRWKNLHSRGSHSEGPGGLKITEDMIKGPLQARARCYASIIYGTRRCEWVQLQQRGTFCSNYRIYQKTNFLESELELVSLMHQYDISST